MTNCKPGTVAEITIDDDKKYRALFDGEHWRFADRGVAWGSAVTHVRPLVVLDLLPGEAVELADYLQGVDMHLSVGDRARIARQIRQQTKPPRIPEPSIYGVVEAGHPQKDGKRSNFVRIIDEGDRRHWVDETYEADLSEWVDLIDPVLIREGV